MGCNCGGGGRASTVARGSSSRALVGFTPSEAVLIGEDDGSDTRRVRVARALPEYNLRATQSAWVKGDGVSSLLSDESLIDITGRNQRGRVWKVGEFTHFSYDDALRASQATGLPPVEVL